MVDFANPTRPSERIGNADRDAAVAALTQAREEGRLSSVEFEERVASARSSVTWGDLAPLFADLPPSISGAAGAAGAGGGFGATAGWNSSAPADDDWGSSRALGGGWGATIMAFVPFLALGLFFIAGFAWDGWAWSWLFFLLVPVAGVIIYGPASQQRRRR
ncbi:DUF1707 SHOCT-like domain-containing protein [Agromyces larvae]|uniref:DUF1707 domain-containing protein n=1 Tax=Agromyces larvae TaxID=2929802 RepID=A0ABY4C105_9MICO|nr:DUF1707 domain-containing protein [Agromyces larvae]UOE43648.1 DUF1707 domain-containing protein [Agromyces larvae]